MSLLPTEDRVEGAIANTRSLKDILFPNSSTGNNNNNNNNGSNNNTPSNNESDNENEIAMLENYLSSLSTSITKSERRLREKEEELAAHVQEGHSPTYALTFHQFAQNLAVSEQILASNGLDLATDILSLNKIAINKHVANQSLMKKFAAKAVETSIPEAWEEFKKKRISQLTAKEEANITIPPTSNLNTYLLNRLSAFNHKILSFLQEEIELLEKVFKGVGPVQHLVHTLYHSIYSRRIRETLSLSLSFPSSSSSPSSPSSPPRPSSPTHSYPSPRHSSSPRLSSSPRASPRPSYTSSSPSPPASPPQPQRHSHPHPHPHPHPVPVPVRRQSSELQFQGRSRSDSNHSNHSNSNNTSLVTNANSTTISSASNITIPSESAPVHGAMDWDDWSTLCLDVRKEVAAFSKEAARVCGISSSAEFERYFPLIPVFHEACTSAVDLLSEKIAKTFADGLEIEREAFNQNKTYPSSHIPSRNTFRSHPHISDSPLLKKRELNLSPNIALSVNSIMKNLDDIVEFVASLQFRPLIDTFLRSILSPMITLSNRLALAARDVPQINSVEFLCINPTAALHERLVIYEQVLAPAHRSFYFTPSTSLAPLSVPLSPVLIGSTNNSRSFRRLASSSEGFVLNTSTSNLSYAPTMGNLWECQKMIDIELYKQADQLVDILVDFCCTHIFPNIDMNEWQDHRVFYADSRPSHGIQMLQFFLKSQYHILHTHMLRQCVQYVISNTLRRCGELMIARYSSISPSRMRSNHYRFDITYLVATIQSLQSACGVWYNKLCMPSICTSLISLMTVVIGPLDLVSPFLQRYSRQKRSFQQPPASVVISTPSLDGIIPHFPSELWPGAEPPLRVEVSPIEDMQFLIEKHSLLASYQYNYSAILENCCYEFSPTFMGTLISHRPELRETIYPPLSDSDKELLSTLLEFLRPP